MVLKRTALANCVVLVKLPLVVGRLISSNKGSLVLVLAQRRVVIRQSLLPISANACLAAVPPYVISVPARFEVDLVHLIVVTLRRNGSTPTVVEHVVCHICLIEYR